MLEDKPPKHVTLSQAFSVPVVISQVANANSSVRCRMFSIFKLLRQILVKKIMWIWYKLWEINLSNFQIMYKKSPLMLWRWNSAQETGWSLIIISYNSLNCTKDHILYSAPMLWENNVRNIDLMTCMNSKLWCHILFFLAISLSNRISILITTKHIQLSPLVYEKHTSPISTPKALSAATSPGAMSIIGKWDAILVLISMTVLASLDFAY